MPQTIEWWQYGTQTYQPAGPQGIAVVTDDTNYSVYNPARGRYEFATFPAAFRGLVSDALGYLRRTPTGQLVLQALHNHGGIGIAPTTAESGNSARSSGGDAGLNQVAAELLAAGRPGAITRTAVDQAAGPTAANLGRSAWWLAGVINATPRWTLDDLPGQGNTYLGMAQSARDWVNTWIGWTDTNEGYFNTQRWLGGPWGTTAWNLGLAGGEVNTWLNGGALPGRLGAAEQNQAVIATLAAVRNHSPAGNGSGSDIGWNFRDTHPMNRLRPPAIGLGHELIHAYFTARGEQLGRDSGHYSTVLFEYRCVGLGPWDEAQPSENSLRLEWHAVVPHVPVQDAQNRIHPAKRIRYN